MIVSVLYSSIKTGCNSFTTNFWMNKLVAKTLIIPAWKQILYILPPERMLGNFVKTIPLKNMTKIFKAVCNQQVFSEEIDLFKVDLV